MEKKSKVESQKSKDVTKKATKPAIKVANTDVEKKAPLKKSTKTEKVASTIPATIEKASKRKAGDVTIDVMTPDGKTDGTMNLPEDVFAAKVNEPLMAQAVRVYLANQRAGSASTKTRGEVEGSTRKIYKQKGTGRARHGAIRAPIFVGGGVALGPKPKDYRLDFPKKMKKAALASAFTSQLVRNSLRVVKDLTTLEMKTKAYATMFTNLSCDGKTLMLLSNDELGTIKAMRNLERVEVMPITNAHTYTVLHHKYIVMTKNAVSEITKHFEEK